MNERGGSMDDVDVVDVLQDRRDLEIRLMICEECRFMVSII